MKLVDQHYSFGINKNPPKAGKGSSKAWSNPLEFSLPNAPNMIIACMYGVDKSTERAYVYRRFTTTTTTVRDGDSCDVGGNVATTIDKESCPSVNNSNTTIITNATHLEIDDDASEGRYTYGVNTKNGDGTIPIESLGLMCSSTKLWNGKTNYNPSGMKTVIKEYKHDQYKNMDMNYPLNAAMQGGPESSDHVAILGNHELISDILNIVTQKGQMKKNIRKDIPDERIISNLLEIQKNVDINVDNL